MAWKETCVLEERVAFARSWEEGEESVAALCRAYGISRKTGYKWARRYEGTGVEGLRDRSRAAYHHPNAVPDRVREAVMEARFRHPTWGPKKLRAWLVRGEPDVAWPASSTMSEWLRRLGLAVPRGRRRRAVPWSEPFAACEGPNQVWTADFKGWFRVGDGTRCDPLTIQDAQSRYLVRCHVAADLGYATARGIFEAAFRQYGLPEAMRSDNGTPFANTGLGGLSRLSVWWLKLGILPERIDAGHPEQNGRHERMHRTLQQETASPPAGTLRAQQRRFERFRVAYNEERPHEALGMRVPAEVYTPSPRAYPERVGDFTYGDLATRRVQSRGEMMWWNRKVFLTKVLEGEVVGLEALDGRHWSVQLGPLRLGILDTAAFRMLSASESRLRGYDPGLTGGRALRSAPDPAPRPPRD